MFGWAGSQLPQAGPFTAACGLCLKGTCTWDLSSGTRARTSVPAPPRGLFNHWTAREVPASWTFFFFFPCFFPIFLSFFFHLFFISCRLITLQYCIGFLPHIDMNQPWIYMCSPSRSPLPPPSPSHPSGSSQCTSPEHLSHASNLGWLSVSPLTVYLIQCYSLRTSHPRLLPQSPKVCSVHLCLFFCFAYRVIITIFLNSIYIC